jgi:putative membrane protein
MKIFLKGMLMGTADVVPGISGGTLALIVGIYERLINALKNLSPKIIINLLKNLFRCTSKEGRDDFLAEFKKIDGKFLICLGAGVLTAIILGSSFIPYLIIKHTALTFSCFLGLIVPSIFLPWGMIKERKASSYFFFCIGLTITVASTLAAKGDVSSSHQVISFTQATWICFSSAFIAICAMILPGISGSFILMLLGQYIFVLGLVTRFISSITGRVSERKAEALSLVEHFTNTQTVILLGIFSLGCLLGLGIMSRIIHKALEKFHDDTMALLTGMIASAVYVLWPYKIDMLNPDGSVLANKGKWIPRAYNTLPDFSSSLFWQSLLIFALSLSLSYILIRKGNKAQ